METAIIREKKQAKVRSQSYKTKKQVHTRTLPELELEIKGTPQDEIKKLILTSILPSISDYAILYGSGALTLYLNQIGFCKETSYYYLDFNYINKKTKKVAHMCQRDIDIVTDNPDYIIDVFKCYGEVTENSTSGSYASMLSNRGIKTITKYTFNLSSITDSTSRDNPVLYTMLCLLKRIYKKIDITIDFDIVEVIPEKSSESLDKLFKRLTKFWPISNLMRNFYFPIDEDGQMIPKMFSKPQYNSSKKIPTSFGLIDMLEVLKMNMYYHCNILPSTTGTGDYYRNATTKYYSLNYEKNHHSILTSALLTNFNPIINSNLVTFNLPSLPYSIAITQKELTETFFLTEDISKKTLEYLSDETTQCFCMEDFNKGIGISVLKCGHIMHTKCFAKYYIQKIQYKINLARRVVTEDEIESSNNNHQCPFCRKVYDDLSPHPERLGVNTTYFNHQDQMFTAEEVLKSTPFTISKQITPETDYDE